MKFSSNPEKHILTAESSPRSFKKVKKRKIWERLKREITQPPEPLTLKKGHLNAISTFKTESLELLTSTASI